MDHDWRTHENVWRADPGDQDALQRAILARRRAGLPVPGWMSAAAPVDRASITFDVVQILTSPYLSLLHQYRPSLGYQTPSRVHAGTRLTADERRRFKEAF